MEKNRSPPIHVALDGSDLARDRRRGGVHCNGRQLRRSFDMQAGKEAIAMVSV
jgi:hypothetical protein